VWSIEIPYYIHNHIHAHWQNEQAGLTCEVHENWNSPMARAHTVRPCKEILSQFFLWSDFASLWFPRSGILCSRPQNDEDRYFMADILIDKIIMCRDDGWFFLMTVFSWFWFYYNHHWMMDKGWTRAAILSATRSCSALINANALNTFQCHACIELVNGIFK
jgi:hypothetical protein